MKRYPSCTIRALKFAVAGPAIAVLAFMSGSDVLAGMQKPQTVDEALIAIESANSLPIEISSVLDDAKSAFARRENVDAEKPFILLEDAAKTAFAPQVWLETLLNRLASVPAPETPDKNAFIAASEALLQSFDHVSKIYGEQNSKAQQDLAEKLKSRTDRDIDDLSNLMIFPDVATETVKTMRLADVAFSGFFDDQKARLPQLPKADIDALARKYVENSNQLIESPDVDVQNIREFKKRVLSLALVNLSEQDVKTLLAFYKSEAGDAKKKALLSAYRDQINQSNEIMLEGYLTKLAAYIHENPT